MRKLLLAATALVGLGLLAAPAEAQTRSNLAPAAGATTGATLGFVFGGPVGAIIGGFSGAVVGSAVSDADITYVGNHPVEQVYIDGNLRVGTRIGTKVKLYDIEGDPDHAYFYANNRVWIVDRASTKIVYSPGFVVSERAVAYAKKHRVNSVTVSGTIEPGLKLGGDVEITTIPDARGFGYVYVDDQPALVDADTRTVIWVE
jgi:hypothetical protein